LYKIITIPNHHVNADAARGLVLDTVCAFAPLCCSMQATAADLLEIERGICQLQQLGVQGAVLSAMASQAHNKRATLQLSAADLVREMEKN
jgi:hypothetical protein